VGFYGVSSFWSILALMLVANFIYPTLLPLSEALAARMMLQVKLDYGRVRLWGSAAINSV
jgi:PPP family 3-phenylpropionic acid transporter